MKRTIIKLVVLILLIVDVWISRDLLLGTSQIVSLKSDPLQAALTTSLGINHNYLAIEGKDYKVASVHYFDNNQWVVVSITPIGTYSDPGTLALENVSGTYKTILGPSNEFQNASLSQLPNDVANYLKNGK